MGRKKRLAPTQLAEKLLAIREHLGFSQGEMVVRICPETDASSRAIISQYERGMRTPSLVELLNYARLAGVTVDELIDDTKDIRL